MNDDLFRVVSNIIKENQSIVTKEEPPINDADDILIKCFQQEQRARTAYQPYLIFGLIIFLIIQLIYTNCLYYESITKLLSINNIDEALSKQYFDMYNVILDKLQFYTTAVLCEFIAIFYFIVRWGFSSSVTDMFSTFFGKKNKSKQASKKGKS